MVKRFFLALLIFTSVACADLLPTGSEQPSPAFTPAPIPTVNEAFLPPEPTAVPPTAVPTEVPTAVPTPTETPDPLSLSADYQNPTLGILFTHPIDWIVESTSETRLIAGLSPGVAASMQLTRTKAAELVMSISAEQSNGSNPLTLLANNEPPGDISFSTFPESVAFQGGKAAHSVAEVTETNTGQVYFSETYAIVVGDDAYLVEFTRGDTSAEIDREAESQLIDRIVESFQLTGVDREAIVGTLMQEAEDFDAGEMFIDSVVTGTLETGVNHIIGLGSFGSYVFATVADKADVVMTISSNLEPEVPLLTIDNSFAGQPEAVIWSPPFDGGYTINIRDFSFTGGDYAFTVHRVRPQPNFLPQVTTQPNKVPFIYIEPAPGFDPEFKLVNNANVPVLFVDNSGASEVELAVPIDLEDGTYNVELGASTGAVGSYTSTVIYVPKSFSVPNLSREFNIATPLATNTITNGVTGLKTHYITVESNLPHVLIANANADADALIRVRNLDGSERLVIDDFSTGNIETQIVNLPIGSYIVEVADDNDNISNYVVGFYEFFPSGTDQLQFDLSPEADALIIAQPTDDFDAVVAAQDVNYNQVAQSDRGFNGAPEVFILQAGRSVPKGTYTASYSGFEDSTGAAQLGVIYVGPTFLDIGNR